ncbi:hypothetical protein ABW19_dt0201525 [Dactylella cylindrospora]|nr:hypothetical protein ABW19_dt0201525 [Dactylella cylindrospora]
MADVQDNETRLLTPPLSDGGFTDGQEDSKDLKSIQDAMKSSLATPPPEPGKDAMVKREEDAMVKHEDESTAKHENETIETNEQKPGLNAVKPTGRKRGRPSKASKEQEEAKKSSKRIKVNSNVSSGKTKTEGAKNETEETKDVKSKVPKLGRVDWSPEESAYLRQLFTNCDKVSIPDIHKKFEAKFNSGKKPQHLKTRWYKMTRESLVLSPEEESILKKAVNSVENKKTAAILEIYHKEGGEKVTRLTQKFLEMKLREWGPMTKDVGKGKELVEAGADDEEQA